jgi:diketogulonate reductase-like aldo/keto reductase
MRYRPFGPTGAQVPVVGQGTWEMERDDRRQAVAALRAGLDAGLTHVDTAEMYGDGLVEELVGEAIAGRRDEVLLVSKVLPSNASRRGTVAACERSLARLRTDRLDVYLLHWPGEIPLEETIAGFEELAAAGRIRAWGVSNFDEKDLAEAVRLGGRGRILCDQVLYNIQERAIEHAVLPYCAHHGIALVAYSPFGHGSFPAPHGRGGKALAEVAARHGGVSPRAVALAFLLHHPSVFAIPKAARPEHIADNAAAGDLELDGWEIRHLEEAFPRGPRRPGVPVL